MHSFSFERKYLHVGRGSEAPMPRCVVKGRIVQVCSDVTSMVAMATRNTDNYHQLEYRAVSSNFQIWQLRH
jgi:hypothetical protein